MNKKLTFLLSLLVTVTIVKSQKDTVSENGMIVFFNDRNVFFKTKISSIHKFLSSNTDTGMEIIDAPRIPEIFNKAEKVKVLIQTQENNHIVGDSIFLAVAPANVVYKKKKKKDEPCSIIFNKDNKKYELVFFCAQKGYEIVNVFSNKLNIKPWRLKSEGSHVL